MQFLCPVCRREEEVVGDRNPRCLVCRVEMIPPSDPSEVWMSPIFAIRRMRTINETYGSARAHMDGKFKKHREAWTTAMLALALNKLTSQEWWIEITAENTPDTRLRRIAQEPGGNIIETREIEIVDWEKNTDDIMEVIRKKCARAYPSNYQLLVNARNSSKELNFDRIIEEMKKLSSPFLEVWVFVFVKPDNFTVVRVAPLPIFVELTQPDFENARKQTPFLKRLTRSTKSEFQNLGLVYMPIPRGD